MQKYFLVKRHSISFTCPMVLKCIMLINFRVVQKLYGRDHIWIYDFLLLGGQIRKFSHKWPNFKNASEISQKTSTKCKALAV